jgi:protoporphyrinogen IX oxidase
MTYLWFKAFHIIGVVVWFAGLFYLGRLFVYHVEANEQPEPARTILQQQYQIMEKRLYNLITTPGMVLTVVMAIALLIVSPSLLKDGWLHAKLAFVAANIGYHFYCGYLMKQMAAGTFKWGSQQLRGLNEVPTVFLAIIVLLAVFKNSFPTDSVAWGIVAMIILMIVTIQLYAKKRRLDKERAAAALSSNSGEISLGNNSTPKVLP